MISAAAVSRILVATDIAARGIDVKGIDLVINYDLPKEADSYVHRIGRTARAGAEGRAISFCDELSHSLLRDIERTIRGKIPVDRDHPFHQEPTEEMRNAKRQAQGGGGGGSRRRGGGGGGGGRRRGGKKNPRGESKGGGGNGGRGGSNRNGGGGSRRGGGGGGGGGSRRRRRSASRGRAA